MKKTHITTLAIVGLIMVAALAFVSTDVQAATGTIGSTVSIECPVEVISNGGSLNFGYLAAPSVGCDEWTVSPIVGPLVHTGSGNGFDFILTDHSKGSFQIKGSESIAYSVAVTTDFPDLFLTLSLLTLDPISPQDPSPTGTGCSTKDISVGGTLTVCPGVAPGLHAGLTGAVITITASY